MAFSPDGKTLASGSGDSTIRLWDMDTGKLIHTIEGHRADVNSVSFSPDGKTLASGSADSTIGLWDVDTGKLIHTLEGHVAAVNSVSFSPDGKTLASASADNTICLWELSSIDGVNLTVPPPVDVNKDGIVNIQDLVLVANSFGQSFPEDGNPVDVNGDGVVNIQDLVQVAGAIGGNRAAPSAWQLSSGTVLTSAQVQHWLTLAEQLNLTDATSQQGIRFLEQLLTALTPQETVLLTNYPNPFNPETWIPYQLAAPAEVIVVIYSTDGKQVRQLSLGYQPVGIYHSKNRAVYWDGRNAQGEPVASGVYFYTLTAGDFSATKKMMIRK